MKGCEDCLRHERDCVTEGLVGAVERECGMTLVVESCDYAERQREARVTGNIDQTLAALVRQQVRYVLLDLVREGCLMR